LLSYVTLRGELNEAEQANILEAEEWAFARKRDVLSEAALNELSKRMFGRVWSWAGQIRTRLVSIHPYSNGNGRHARRWPNIGPPEAPVSQCRPWKEQVKCNR
jgi:fido (protein-threonine AMPylation protein)